MNGVVMQGTGGQWHVRADNGATHLAALRGRVKHAAGLKLAVGDRVTVEDDPAGDLWAITAIEPRRSTLARRNPSGARGERIIAANLDQVMIVFAMIKPEPNELMLDRFLVIVEANDLAARVVINKTDLANAQEARERFQPYESAGYPVHYVSTRTRAGLDDLHEAVKGKVTALSGPSGVGKSSIMNAMYPGLDLRVGEISESVNKGRHTTVGAQMHALPDCGFVVDTPGLREIGLWGINPSAVAQCFPDFRDALGNCKFADCRHVSEPGCAVTVLVQEGKIGRRRYESYVKLYEEARTVDRL
jgi:ribosome biogenesis GTPase / thiamine phosphate phosphatase